MHSDMLTLCRCAGHVLTQEKAWIIDTNAFDILPGSNSIFCCVAAYQGDKGYSM